MLKRILKTSFFSLGSRGFLTLTNLTIMYAVARYLGNETLGIYSISAFYYYLAAFLTSFELTTYFGKEVAHLRDRAGELKKLVGQLAFTFIVGLGFCVVVLLFSLVFYRKISMPVLLTAVLSGIVFGVEKNLSGLLLGKEKMHLEFIAQLVTFVLVALPVLFRAPVLGITGIYLVRAGASLVTVALRRRFLRSDLPFQWPIARRGKSGWREYFRGDYNWKEIKFFSASGFAYFIQHHIDLFILSFLISTELEGAYFLALRIYLSFCLLAEMTSFALTPYISRLYRRQEGDQVVSFHGFYKKIVLVGVLLGLSASVLLFFSRDFLVGFFSRENPELSSGFLFYFSFILFFRFVSYYTGNMLTATRYQDLRFYILVFSALLMMVLEVVLGSFFSVLGVIYARGIMELCIFVGYFLAATKIRHRELN